MKTDAEIAEYAQSIVGWLSGAEGMFLLQLARNKTVLEIGSLYGKSTAFMAPVAKSIVCVDSFMHPTPLQGGPDVNKKRIPEDDIKGPGNTLTLRGFLEHTKIFDNVLTVVGTSQDAALAIAPASFDLLFIDAGHSYEDVAKDIKSWIPKLKPDGIVAFHDYVNGHPGVKKAVDESFVGNDGTAGSIVSMRLNKLRQ